MEREAQDSLPRMTVTELGDFLRGPPNGFSVESNPLRSVVRGDPDTSLLLADPCDTSAGSVVFHGSLGRSITLTDLWQYSDFRRSLVSKNIFVLVATRMPQSTEVAKLYVVCMRGADPVVRWHMEAGLNWAISSVAGESYEVEVDLTDALDTWAASNMAGIRPEWVDASFTLKYHSDALFDFPHWLGFSKRKFKLRLS
ncbi:mesenteric estrogen-dependent adipogenesis protein-like [Syngnathoides biaculeatus]|uniref:mesenteric estrogen-dependent adipogenesis protein-like n=1 Tax=Syngnathoides biaculeatus TaxID=300417 RepID=UPI002ADDEEDD|nr:mesenteric estrogen-dependent adipogenesis protein-like [Syngnathoides biaculeatus]